MVTAEELKLLTLLQNHCKRIWDLFQTSFQNSFCHLVCSLTRLDVEKDDEIEEGDLPEHKRSPPPIDFSKIDASKPEDLLKMSKKGRTLMVFATVSGNPTEKETEEITSLWQGSLFNANFDVQRFVVGSNRVIFMLRDGSYAWEIKDFLIAQDRCEDVTVEGQVYPGKTAKKDAKGNEQNKTKKKGDKKAANRGNKSKQEL
ncbi:LRP chaperone MESD-like isoform X2 [Carassius carassius]|uniref:LRP chaperone MESD-like isoform X2 n=1 Tax=Carassius carassius TaxID=217509 RepID=UPI0028694F5D|nr:LRP chaperone MESD-like isoform X2 [Carassius carassius]